MKKSEVGVGDSEEPRFRVVAREGVPHGDLYELEQSSYWDVVETQSGQVVLSFEGEYSATLGSGAWENGHYQGVRNVELDECGTAVRVWTEGVEDFELVPIPGA